MKKSFKQKIERRRFPRAMASVLYRTHGTSGEKQPVTNLSLGGVRIYSDDRLDLGLKLGLEFYLPNGSVVEAEARVVWVKDLPPGSKGLYDVGMEYIKISEKGAGYRVGSGRARAFS